MELGFGEVLLFGGALLAAAAALSGVFRGTVLSVSVLGVAAGLLLAGTGVIEVSAEDDAVIYLIELALIVTLFSDGLLVDRERLKVHWSPPVRALLVAMPLTLLFLALCAKVLFSELSWAEAFLLGAVLSPTDPVVTSAVVKSRGVPESVRHTLNLESGLNDGLALPLVLFFIILASPRGRCGRGGAAAARRGRCGGGDRGRPGRRRRQAHPPPADGGPGQALRRHLRARVGPAGVRSR